MKYSQFFIPTLREAPGDAVVASHKLMLRSGMIRRLANGLFAYLPLGLRSLRKLERIIREEMDAAGALEVKPTVVVPGELWKESGRWDTMGQALLRVKNRLNGDFVVSPTAEEALTSLLRDDLSSYKQLPLNLYQINTKYRDEVRPRYGVMRGREFIMKDAYSFHTDDASLDETYQEMGRAYRRIFRRAGLSVIPVRADSGAMGGSGSEEFMVESGIGDNTLILCRACAYAANVEKAACKPDFTALSPAAAKEAAASLPPPGRIDTPDVKSIADLCAFLKTDSNNFIKTLVYRADNIEADGLPAGGGTSSGFFAVLIRGDLEVNETKLAALLRASEVNLAEDTDVERLTGAPVGFAGPLGLKGLTIVADETVSAMTGAVTGALARDAHYQNVAFGRDFTPDIVADIRTVTAGDRCPICGGELYEKKGNELGHIFKLGYKYTKSMKVSFLDADGKSRTPLMGCYGIGLDRTLAAVIEEHHDQAGIIWPVSLAPFEALVVPVKYEGAAGEAADKLYAELARLGVDTLLDDRRERAGVKFNDADLTGIPFRVVIGDKNLASRPPLVELKRRGQGEARLVGLAEAAAVIAREIRTELAELDGAGGRG
ncbi:MAG: proline--tRNA ligase [Spirochaetaceae bacterium]|jgi:prolyl-tRNA synthetase|nr:proline--tRNA ligase [Spirochaetaceae bacterium]